MRIRLLFLLFLLPIAFSVGANTDSLPNHMDESHRIVALRMVGHELLLCAGDSTSQVLPIKRTGNRYQLEFATEVPFNTEDLVYQVNQVARRTSLGTNYVVSVEACADEQVVYSFEVGHNGTTDLIPCLGRDLPVACYALVFTFPEVAADSVATPPTPADQSNTSFSAPGVMVGGLLLLIVLLFIPLWQRHQRQKGASITDEAYLPVGTFRFSPQFGLLSHAKGTIELTSKESELLAALHQSANATVERQTLLRTVWGDEGDYVGRTLDVYISKLRKKLADNPGVKIVNVRGVGYKLILSASSQ